MDVFIGYIAAFGFNFAPRNWAQCNGQLIAISQNSALFSLLGTTYGGNGIQNFALPDLRSRTPIHEGQGPGLSNYVLGEVGGTETVTLNSTQMPQHNHMISVTGTTNSPNPSGNLASPLTDDAGSNTKGYSNTGATGMMSPLAVTAAGGSQPHDNMQPYLAVNWCIALYGIFPSRN